MSLEEIRDFLLSITLNTYHYKAKAQPDTYIVWAEDGEAGAIHGDNRKLAQILDVTIDVFTRDEYPEIIKALQDGFNDKGVPFELLNIQYEEDTEYTHYEYLIQAVI